MITKQKALTFKNQLPFMTEIEVCEIWEYFAYRVHKNNRLCTYIQILDGWQTY